MRRAERVYWLVFAVCALLYAFSCTAAFRWMAAHKLGG